MLKLGDSWTNYPLHFHELESNDTELIFEDDRVQVSTIPLVHRVYTNGFLFQGKPFPRKLDIEAAKSHDIDASQFNNIKAGKNGITADGQEVPNSALTHDPPLPKSYAFCSDTKYSERIISIIKGVDVLYHESTFLESEAHLCERTKHATAKQAATIAQKSEVGQLILGHFSTRYKNLNLFKEEAQEIFRATELADDGKHFEF